MRVAVLTTHLPPVLGGIEIHCENLATALTKRGHRVVLYGSLEPGQRDMMRAETRGVQLMVRRVPAFFVWPFRRPSRLLYLRRLLLTDHRKAPFDLVHAHQIWPVAVAGAWLAGEVGVRLIITEHGSVIDDSKSPLKRFAIRWACRRAGRVLTASKELASVVTRAGVPQRKIVSVPNAISLDQFHVEGDIGDARRELGIPQNAFVVMTVRRLVPKTGIQYAIRAVPQCVANVPNFLLVVVGGGPMRSELERLAHSLGVEANVRFVGPIDNRVVPRYMQAADLGLFPSLAEATSIAAVEFMATGTPIAASCVGGLPEIIVDGETGFLFDIGFTRSQYDDPGLPPASIENIARSVLQAARANLRAMGKRAARRVQEEFSWDAYARRLETEFYTNELT